MTYKINILKNANDDLNWFRRNDKTSYIKAFDMTREMMVEPRMGIGKPERLKHFEKLKRYVILFSLSIIR